MKRSIAILGILGLGAGLCGVAAAQAQNTNMSFFITSVGKGKGANLGGLAGADAHCNALAKAAGSAKTNWRAYLSTTEVEKGPAPVDARDRIGKGPWVNAKGVVIAKDINDLHDAANTKLTKATLLTEKGEVVSGRADKINKHDILTGSDSAGRYLPVDADSTCGNWTKSGAGAAVVGHHDRNGPNNNRNYTSWNSSHISEGCGQADLAKSGGAGLFYCFAAN